MRFGSQLIGSFATLLLLQAATSLVAISLLGRMSPAIERIVQENVISAAAVEQMALILASPLLDDRSRDEYREALDRARNNVTEPDGRLLLAEVQDLAEPALAGVPEGRARSLEILASLGSINRDAMARARDEAKRLGTAGAWAVAFLGFLGLGASFLSMTRARRRILAPLAEITRVVSAHRAGEAGQRCTEAAGARGELARVGDTLNDLLDHYERTRAERNGATRDSAKIERDVLLRLLDERAEPTAIVDAYGELLAANREAETLLAGAGGRELRDALRQTANQSDTNAIGLVSARPIGDMGATMCVLESASGR